MASRTLAPEAPAGPGTKTRKIALQLAILLFTAGAFAWLFYGDTSFGQARRMSLAHRHEPVVAEALAPRPEFARIKVGVTPGAGGRLLILGSVSSTGDLESLRRLIAGTNPPVETVYAVSVDAKP
jgi:hypothetical protein